MNLLTNLIINLENDLSKRKIYEPIILRSSNVANFDFQINNLVKLIFFDLLIYISLKF
jgi:hypothetical protein